MRIMNSEILKEIKEILEKERKTLTTELKSIAKPNPHIKGDWTATFPAMGAGQTGSHSGVEELADEIEEYETRLEAEHTLESRLLNINTALERIEKGTYGKCKKCKKEIPLERLRANPAAEFDIEHTT
jgi:RNA polymerase-binding transcription factor DksA